jgi:hypothetical protein
MDLQKDYYLDLLKNHVNKNSEIGGDLRRAEVVNLMPSTKQISTSSQP